MCFYGHHIYLYHVQSISALYNQQRAAEYISSVHPFSCWADVTIRYWTVITWQLNENFKDKQYKERIYKNSKRTTEERIKKQSLALAN